MVYFLGLEKRAELTAVCTHRFVMIPLDYYEMQGRCFYDTRTSLVKHMTSQFLLPRYLPQLYCVIIRANTAIYIKPQFNHFSI